MDYKNRCRTCLGSGKEMRNVHSSIKIAGLDVILTDILKKFYNYQITPDELLPDNLCINCVHQLTITYSFKKLIDSTLKTLTENLYHINSTCDTYSHDYEEDQKPIVRKNYVKKKKHKKKIKTLNNSLSLLYCVECKAEFNSVKSLNKHCSNNHPLKSQVGRECEYCHEKFDDFRSLVLHRKLHIKPYLCENCWEGFYSENELTLHLCQPHVKDKNKSNKDLRQCDQCGKSYPPGYIKIHMLTHSNHRAYSCKFCPKKFKVPGGLNSHVLWNHKRTRDHKCEVCGATFVTSSAKSSHIRKNHLKEKKYCCDSCSKRFFSKSELQRHLLSHTGVKDFHCHLCDKSYQTRYGLNVHLKSHSQMNLNVMDL